MSTLLDALPTELFRPIVEMVLPGPGKAVYYQQVFDRPLRVALEQLLMTSKRFAGIVLKEASAVAIDAQERQDWNRALFLAMTLCSTPYYPNAAKSRLLCVAVAARLRQGTTGVLRRRSSMRPNPFALQDARRAVRLDCRSPVALQLCGDALVTYGRHREAAACFAEALEKIDNVGPDPAYRARVARKRDAAEAVAESHESISLIVNAIFKRANDMPKEITYVMRTDSPLEYILEQFVEPPIVTTTELRILRWGSRLDPWHTPALAGLADGDDLDVFLEQPDPRLLHAFRKTRIAAGEPPRRAPAGPIVSDRDAPRGDG